VSGDAISPHHGSFCSASTTPLPTRATLDGLRRAGVAAFEDVVRSRRYLAYAVAAGGVAMVAAGMVGRRIASRHSIMSQAVAM